MAAKIAFTNVLEPILSNTFEDITSTVSGVASTVDLVENKIQTVSELLQESRDEFLASTTKLSAENKQIAAHVETLTKCQLDMIDTTISGLRSCTELIVNVRSHIERKLTVLTILAVTSTIASIAAVIISIMR